MTNCNVSSSETSASQRCSDRKTALQRLVNFACEQTTVQSSVVAEFLLGLYDGPRFKFDLTAFRLLNPNTFDDCLAVLELDNSSSRRVHEYFREGEKLFESMAINKVMPVTDFPKQQTRHCPS